MPIFSSLYGTRLDRELGTEDRSVLFTTARRKAAINEAQGEFAELTECFTKQSTLTLAGGTAEYDLNDSTTLGDFVRLSMEQVQFRYVDASSNVTVLAGDDLPRRDVPWLNKYEPGWEVSTVASSLQQMPQVYYERTEGGSRYLGFWPTPSTGSSASMTAVVPYVAAPVPMTSDTNEPFQANGRVRTDLRPYHQGLVHYAAYQLEKLRRDPEAANAQLQTFLGYVMRYVQNKRVKGGKQLTQVKNYFRRHGNDRGEDPRT
jgi:hypothetical protein